MIRTFKKIQLLIRIIPVIWFLLEEHKTLEPKSLYTYSKIYVKGWEWFLGYKKLEAFKEMIEIISYYINYINRGRPDCKVDNNGHDFTNYN